MVNGVESVGTGKRAEGKGSIKRQARGTETREDRQKHVILKGKRLNHTHVHYLWPYPYFVYIRAVRLGEVRSLDSPQWFFQG